MSHDLTDAERLLRLRELLGLSQREIAEELGVSKGAVAFWENGERPIPGPILKLIELHELHFAPEKRNAPAAQEEENEALSSQWAEAIVAKTGIRTPQRRKQIQAELNGVLKTCLAEGLSSSDPIKRRVQIAVARQLVESLGQAKGIPLKAAQLASYLDFNIPDELREALAKLQTMSEPMPAGAASRVVFEELGKRPEQLFAEWSPKPFAAASIGQVHRARLHTGELVAVKVQYPEVKKAIEKDLEDLSIFHHLAVLLAGANPEVIREFKEAVLQECDYRQEAENQEKFRAAFEGDAEILIPRVYPELSTQRVLTSELIDGVTFTEFLAKASQEQRDQAGRTIVRFFILSGLKHGLLQGDPHPGNYLFCKDRVAFVDFGRVRGWDDETRLRERDLLMALVENDAESGMRLLKELGLVQQEISGKDLAGFWEFFSAQHTPLTVDQPFQYSRTLIRERVRAARGARRNPMAQVNRPLFWDVYLGMSANAIRGDMGSTSNWHRHMVPLLKEAGATPRKKS